MADRRKAKTYPARRSHPMLMLLGKLRLQGRILWEIGDRNETTIWAQVVAVTQRNLKSGSRITKVRIDLISIFQLVCSTRTFLTTSRRATSATSGFGVLALA